MHPDEKVKQKARSRAIFLRYSPLIAVLLLDLIFLAMLDTLFANKKRALIFDLQKKFTEIFVPINPLKDRMQTLLNDYRQSRSYGKTDAAAKAYEEFIKNARLYLEKTAPKILDADDHPFYSIILIDNRDQLIYEYENEDKLHEWNDWTNCLFSRSFHAPVGTSYNSPAGTPEAHLTVFYASPKGWPEIEAMVMRYWIYAILFVISTWIIHFWLSRNVFRPLQGIGSAMEYMIGSSKIALIQHPRMEIENAFNQMARNQREILFGLQVDRIVDELHAFSDDRLVIEQFLLKLRQAVPFAYPASSVLSYIAADSHRLIPLDQESHGPAPAVEAPSQPIVWEAHSFMLTMQSGERMAGALRCEFPPDVPADEVQNMAQEVRKQAENGLARCVSRSRALIQERNRFGINLATNMGHDLTNIIASGKWDLDTIHRAQSAGIISLDPQKGKFFEDAVQGLRDNLQSLQEMVDIYRSVAYIQRPSYEWIDLAEMAHDVRELFRRSTSHSMLLEVTDHGPVQMYIEPRLMRMALFNLMTNAYQAIQRAENSNGKGKIHIEVSAVVEGLVNITVSDNGPGIRDLQGNLLQDEEINRIFQSGYSTKKESNGSGLGLAWVKSIVEEFHGGHIHATNNPQGGASVRITLPLQCEDLGSHSS